MTQAELAAPRRSIRDNLREWLSIRRAFQKYCPYDPASGQVHADARAGPWVVRDSGKARSTCRAASTSMGGVASKNQPKVADAFANSGGGVPGRVIRPAWHVLPGRPAFSAPALSQTSRLHVAFPALGGWRDERSSRRGGKRSEDCRARPRLGRTGPGRPRAFPKSQFGSATIPSRLRFADATAHAENTRRV